ncbi:MAG: GTPase, partial [archaeon]|nr:GTPase [archaeon]
IPIFDEAKLAELVKKFNVQEVALSYSDLSHEYVMHFASMVQATGADFVLLGPFSTQLVSKKPVISVCAVRTGSGKSQTSRKIAERLLRAGKKVAVVRHPMPYGDLAKEAVQRFAKFSDFEKHHVTIEEREEYESYVERGIVVFAGVDYEKILRLAEKEADIVIWDGGNNDFPFFKPDLQFVVADPLRAGHEVSYYPGETNFRMADVIIINKVNSAKKSGVQKVVANAKKFNPFALVVLADSVLRVSEPGKIKGKRVLVVEDGPTLTHGGMPFGAGFVAAKKFGCREVVDAQKSAVGSILEVYKKYPHLRKILPAMGYSKKQVHELEQTINNSSAEIVVSGTPIDLGRSLKVNKEIVSVRYELAEKGKTTLESILKKHGFI